MEREQSSLFSAVWTDLPSSVTPSEIFTIPAQRIFEYCQSIPCEDILIVDYLWVHFSDGRFGLSVQNKMAQESGLKSIDNMVTWKSCIEGRDSVEILAHCCGWREDNYWISYEDLTFDIKAPMGHLPVNHLFLVDQASGFLPINHVFGKRETHVAFAPIVWHALASRLNLCWRYQQLETYLRNEQWREADQETYRVMIQTVGKEVGQWFDGEDLPNFPCEHLQIIDHLWVKYSNAKFGFSVQKKIWLECGSPETLRDIDWKPFGERVGWYVKDTWIAYNNVTFSTSASEGHLPIISPPFKAKSRGSQIVESGVGGFILGFMYFGVSWILLLLSRTENCEHQREQQLKTSWKQLETYLRNGQWYEADQETYSIMIQIVEKENKLFDIEDLEDFPCEDLHILDQLWVKYSNGKFGFSVQKRIWLECGSPTIYNDDWQQFKDRVGWLVNQKLILYCQLTFDTSAPEGHLPCWGGWNILGDTVGRFVGNVGRFSLIFALSETCGL